MRWSRKQLLGSSASSLVALAALFLASPVAAGAAAASRAECLRSRSSELAALASCGHEGSIQNCLSRVPAESPLCAHAALEKCYVIAGCTAEEAAIEATWTLKRCDERADADDMADLRRRQRTSSDADNKDNTPKGGQKNTAQPAAPP